MTYTSAQERARAELNRLEWLMEALSSDEVDILATMLTEAKLRGAEEGWKEAAIAWSVCASIHRSYCEGRDPLFTTRQRDFAKHEEDARAKLRALSPDGGDAPERDNNG